MSTTSNFSKTPTTNGTGNLLKSPSHSRTASNGSSITNFEISGVNIGNVSSALSPRSILNSNTKTNSPSPPSSYPYQTSTSLLTSPPTIVSTGPTNGNGSTNSLNSTGSNNSNISNNPNTTSTGPFAKSFYSTSSTSLDNLNYMDYTSQGNLTAIVPPLTGLANLHQQFSAPGGGALTPTASSGNNNGGSTLFSMSMDSTGALTPKKSPVVGQSPFIQQSSTAMNTSTASTPTASPFVPYHPFSPLSPHSISPFDAMNRDNSSNNNNTNLVVPKEVFEMQQRAIRVLQQKVAQMESVLMQVVRDLNDAREDRVRIAKELSDWKKASTSTPTTSSMGSSLFATLPHSPPQQPLLQQQQQAPVTQHRFIAANVNQGQQNQQKLKKISSTGVIDLQSEIDRHLKMVTKLCQTVPNNNVMNKCIRFFRELQDSSYIKNQDQLEMFNQAFREAISILIDGYLKNNNTKSVVKLIETLKKSHYGYLLTLDHFHKLIEAFLRLKQYQEVLECLSFLREESKDFFLSHLDTPDPLEQQHLTPRSMMIQGATSLYGEEYQEDTFLSRIDSKEDFSYLTSPPTYAAAASSSSSSGAQPFGAVEDGSQIVVKPDQSTYNLIIQTLFSEMPNLDQYLYHTHQSGSMWAQFVKQHDAKLNALKQLYTSMKEQQDISIPEKLTHLIHHLK